MPFLRILKSVLGWVRWATELCRELSRDGLTIKAWRRTDGKPRIDTPMDKKYLSKALPNPTYVGEIRHKGLVYPGQHSPIISRHLWDQVRAILAQDAQERMGKTNTLHKTTHCCGACPPFAGRRKLVRFHWRKAGKEKSPEIFRAF